MQNCFWHICLCISICICPSICLCLPLCKKFWEVGRNIWNSTERGTPWLLQQYFSKICTLFKLVDMNLFAFQRCIFAIQRIHKFNWNTVFCNTSNIPSSKRPTNHLWRKKWIFTYIGNMRQMLKCPDHNVNTLAMQLMCIDQALLSFRIQPSHPMSPMDLMVFAGPLYQYKTETSKIWTLLCNIVVFFDNLW